MTIVPAPGKLPADGGGWSFSGTRGEGRTERGDGFPPFRLEKIKKREQKRRLRCPLMLETGMRPEEVYRIQPENVNLTGGYLFNPHGKTKATRRRVPLTTAARGVLHRRRDGPEDFPPLPVRDGPRPTRAQGEQCPRPRCEGGSKVAPFRLYDRVAEAGIDLVTLAALLGHSKIHMVLRYAHPTQQHQTQAAERLERFAAARQMESVLPEDQDQG
jgi:integrase